MVGGQEKERKKKGRAKKIKIMTDEQTRRGAHSIGESPRMRALNIIVRFCMGDEHSLAFIKKCLRTTKM